MPPLHLPPPRAAGCGQERKQGLGSESSWSLQRASGRGHRQGTVWATEQGEEWARGTASSLLGLRPQGMSQRDQGSSHWAGRGMGEPPPLGQGCEWVGSGCRRAAAQPPKAPLMADGGVPLPPSAKVHRREG